MANDADTETPASLLLWTLLEVSERAARIARECRSEKELFELLVQEKTGKERNTRFLHDFKTLADVFIQEMVKHYLTEKFPVLRTHIHGEETNEFTNAKGHRIFVEMKSTEGETALLLEQVLDGNARAAALLAHAAHAEPRVEESVRADFERVRPQLRGQEIPLDDIGIWIDPIDGTYEYVRGLWDEDSKGGSSEFGLNCCTILIGGYRRSSGVPCIGVVSQPFTTPQGGSTISYFSYGNVSSIRRMPLTRDIVLSSTEDPETIKKLSEKFTVMHCAGAGYKILNVALGLCNVYVCSKTSTYRWDTCAPHALLEAQGGGVRQFLTDGPILYNVGDKAAARNAAGIVAYRDANVLQKVLTLLRQQAP
ncbi:inositol polyphosphate 1-phosphatase [Galendromus occidentalis]|uniref:inositol-1,4-bisphosphate 1-phosphatase n=1 Tax=Galendromus occidentalis TaxID=34638 RepID=A0AAJ6VY42_9ACAR|nr:inositol polyphosphate 1-phosphatase [Galendromus occidentalis]